MGSPGLMGNVEGRATKPNPYPVVDGKVVLTDEKTTATEDEIRTQDKCIEDFEMKEYLARHIIINSV